MKSIYQLALGEEFERLHPRIQERFSLTSESGVAHIGRGVMERVWHGPFWTYPFLCLGTFRRIMFPESGENVPFTIQNYAYKDELDRETVTWIRTFETKRKRRFDAYMIMSEERGVIVDYLGTHQHLAVDIHASVTENGGMKLRAGAQRFYEGPLAFNFPMLFSGTADVCEWYDDDEGRFRIDVNVSNRRWGPLFGYSGWFQNEVLPVETTPEDVLPQRVERRE